MTLTERVQGLSQSSTAWIVAHKVWSAIAAVILILILYWTYAHLTSTSGQTRYVLGTVSTGTVISTLSESGQVSTANQVSIQSKVSGVVTRVVVKNGDTVSAGDPIAYLDSTDAYENYQNAVSNLKSAQLTLQQLQQPPTQLQLTQDQDAIASANDSIATTQATLNKQYQTTYNDIIQAYVDLASVLPGLDSIVTGNNLTSGNIQSNIGYYANQLSVTDSTALSRATQATNDYNAATAQYAQSFKDYSATNQLSSTSTIESIAQETYTTLQSVATSINDASAIVQAYVNLLQNKSYAANSNANTQLSSLSTYLSKINADLNTIQQDTNSLTTQKASLASVYRQINESTQTLAQLQAGATDLQIQSDQLAIQQRQIAVDQAAETLADYTIRAPFDGVIGGMTLVPGESIGSSAVATELSSQQIAQLSVNEVDAAKLMVGQHVTLTFDALTDLTLTGKVAEIDPVGSVSSGVVAYTVSITFDESDPRVKSGMTVNAVIQTAVHSDVLEVPSSAVKTSNGKSTVLVFSPAIADTGGTSGTVSAVAPTSVAVTTGITDGTYTEILSGLQAGEQIVTKTVTSSTNTTTTTTTTSSSNRSSGEFGGGGPGGGAAGIRL